MTGDEARDILLKWYELQKRQEFIGDFSAADVEEFRETELTIIEALMEKGA